MVVVNAKFMDTDSQVIQYFIYRHSRNYTSNIKQLQRQNVAAV